MWDLEARGQWGLQCHTSPKYSEGSPCLPPPSTFSSLHSEHDAPAHLGEEKLSITLKCEASSLEFNLHR